MPWKVILEFELITAAVDQGEGKTRVFALSLIEDIDSSINKSIHSLDHHKYYYILYFD